jgi:hypothetical protein
MSIDPRLDPLLQHAMSELGAGPVDPTVMLQATVQRLAARVSALERTHIEPMVTQVAGTPTFTPVASPWSAIRMDTTTNRVWFWTPIGWRATAALTT